ncbi:hypothetical protein JCM10207_004018, partial [Rhodosporidiobolus poonsookiae]
PDPHPLSASEHAPSRALAVGQGAGEQREGCIFCAVSAENGFAVVLEDPEFVVFRDRSPGSRVHLLAVPRRHVDNVKTLEPGDVGMLRRLRAFGVEALQKVGVREEEARMGFHIPPFFSVNHLHLHLLSLPFPSLKGQLKYRSTAPASFRLSHTRGEGAAENKAQGGWEEGERLKKWGWFVGIDQVIAILEAGERVKVGGVSSRGRAHAQAEAEGGEVEQGRMV